MDDKPFIKNDTVPDLPKIAYPFRNEYNQRYSKMLFWEQWATLTLEVRTFLPPFTLFTDKPGFINFGREYIEAGDVTGYKVTTRHFKDYKWWTFLMKSPWFREAKEIWDVELDAKLYSEGLDKIREIALGETPGALQAAKYLANKEYMPKTDSKRRAGRPTTEEVQGQLKVDAAAERELQADLERISIPKLKAV